MSVRCGRLVATYQHLGGTVVRRGQVVERGVLLGGVGRSGSPRSRTPHLHLGARDASSGRYVDPMRLIGGGARALPPLLPRPPTARPLPLGPAPAPRPLRPARFPRPVAAPAAPGPVPGVPLTVWVGLACVALGLPLGGFITVRRRRRRAPMHVAQAA